MKITGVSIQTITLKLKREFKIAHSTRTEYEGVILKIDTDEGLSGMGEAVPSGTVTGETTGTVAEIFERVIKPVIMNKNPLDIERIMHDLNSAILYNTAIKAAVDIALHDILGKYANIPLCKLLGGFKPEITTSITIGIKGIEETLAEAAKLFEDGVQVFKIKIGLNAREDVEKLKILRQELGSKVKIRVDANQGYTAIEAIKVLKELEKYDIEFMEQPVPYWDIEGMKRVKENVDIPVMADESLHSIHDAIALIRAGACDLFNIKLMKAGGILHAQKIAAIAEGAGIPCMLGCMTETKIGISAATHLGLALKNIKYADLDGHLSIKKDIIQGGVFTQKGVNKVPLAAGIGVEFEFQAN